MQAFCVILRTLGVSTSVGFALHPNKTPGTTACGTPGIMQLLRLVRPSQCPAGHRSSLQPFRVCVVVAVPEGARGACPCSLLTLAMSCATQSSSAAWCATWCFILHSSCLAADTAAPFSATARLTASRDDLPARSSRSCKYHVCAAQAANTRRVSQCVSDHTLLECEELCCLVVACRPAHCAACMPTGPSTPLKLTSAVNWSAAVHEARVIATIQASTQKI